MDPEKTQMPHIPSMLRKHAQLGLTLYDFLRAGHVKRWHIVNTTREQTIADHSHMVAVIALHLFDRMVGVADDPESALKVVVGAIFHDSCEIRTGDTPTPGKEYIRRFTGDPGVFDRIEEDLLPHVPYVGGDIAPAIMQFIKMADAIEAAHWIRDNGAGRHAEIVAAGCWRRLEDLVHAYSTDPQGTDWYGPVNEVLMAYGMPHLLREERITPP